MIIETLVCKRCGYGSVESRPWIPRVRRPSSCPACRTIFWDTARVRAGKQHRARIRA